MKKFIIAAVASLMALNANAALINIYETSLNIGSIAKSQAVINSATSPSSSFSSDNIFYSDVAADGAPGFDNGHNETFVLTATGLLDTSLYSALQFFHDDGITVSLAGNEVYTYDANTGKKDSGLISFADTGLVSFDLLFWENHGAATLLTYGILRGNSNTTEIAKIASVPAPGAVALFALGLISLVTARRRKS